jgi:HrpA-like RNA helicase
LPGFLDLAAVRRHDLKLTVTSATIDLQRFSPP